MPAVVNGERRATALLFPEGDVEVGADLSAAATMGIINNSSINNSGGVCGNSKKTRHDKTDIHMQSVTAWTAIACLGSCSRRARCTLSLSRSLRASHSTQCMKRERAAGSRL